MNSRASFVARQPKTVIALVSGAAAVYRWTVTGRNNGPVGTGQSVRISGYEEWKFGADGLIAEFQGHLDAAEYQRQLTP